LTASGVRAELHATCEVILVDWSIWHVATSIVDAARDIENVSSVEVLPELAVVARAGHTSACKVSSRRSGWWICETKLADTERSDLYRLKRVRRILEVSHSKKREIKKTKELPSQTKLQNQQGVNNGEIKKARF